MQTKQHTIKNKVEVTGIGLHTGNNVKIVFNPAPAHYGIKFVRTDIAESPEIPAHIDYVVDISRGTTLGIKDVKVHTVEHVLAALAFLEIDNVRVELDSNEPPVGDGSALLFTDAISVVGIEEQDALREYLTIDESVMYHCPEDGIDLNVLPLDHFRITCMVDYRNKALGTEYTTLDTDEDDLVKEFASARTFCFLTEVEMLREQGLIKGGTLDNAVVVADKELDDAEAEKLQKMFNLSERPVVGTNGFMNNKELRYYNEPVRHKTLDIVGDMMLLGMPLKGHVIAARSGHKANVELVKKIYKIYKKKLAMQRYKKNKDQKFVMDIEAILDVIPHRYPFLLVDRIIDLDPMKKIVGIKNVTMNEPFFQGHFPGRPIMPGVLIVEAMAQTGGLMLLGAIDDPSKKLIYFMKIDKVKFRKMVVPGDQLRFEIELKSFRRNICTMDAKAYVDDERVAEGVLTAMVADR